MSLMWWALTWLVSLTMAVLHGLYLPHKIGGDSTNYLRSADEYPPAPYHLRWLLPRLLGNNPRRWSTLSLISLVLTGPLLTYYLLQCGCSAQQAVMGGVLYTGLYGVYGALFFEPVLADAPAHLVTLLGLVALQADHTIVACTAIY